MDRRSNVVAMLVAVLLGGCSGSAGSGGAPSAVPQVTASSAVEVPTSSVAVTACPSPTSVTLGTAGRSLKVIGSIDSSIHAMVLESGFGSVWAATSSGLIRLSVPDAKPKVALTGPVDDVALSSTTVFALSSAARQLIELDPTSLTVVHRWALAAGSHSLAAGPNAAYVDFDASPPRVVRYDAKTEAAVSVMVPGLISSATGRDLAVDGASLWITDGRTLERLDPANLQSLGVTSLPIAVDSLWAGDGPLWAASGSPDGGVVRIDPQTGCATVQADGDALQIAFSAHGVWLSAASGPMALDPVSGQAVAALPSADVLGDDAAGIAVVGDEVWTSYQGAGLQRIKSGETK